MKPTINIGQKKSSAEKQVSLLLEKGYDIYVLRLRKLTEYGQTVHGFDDIAVRKYTSPNSMEVNYHLETRPCTYATFVPNEDNVATAYVPGTRRNIDIIASHIYSSQFTLMEIITPTGSIPQRNALQRIKDRADELGITPPKGTKAYESYVKEQNEKKASEGTQAIDEPKKELPDANLPKTVEEAAKKAEAQVHEKYANMIKFLKDKSPKGWKALGEYKSVIKPEVEQLQAELMKLAGIKPEPEKPAVEIEAAAVIE